MAATNRLIVVTASTNTARARDCFASWGDVQIVCVSNGPAVQEVDPLPMIDLTHQGYMGTVAAFRKGVDFALAHSNAEVIACLHDDVEIKDPHWAEKVLRHFDRQPSCGLLGFGGAIGLGSDDLYTTPYDPMHLARIGFRSNMINAEAHGVRSLLSERVACLDGFSQVGRREFWAGYQRATYHDGMYEERPRPWTHLETLGVSHHLYDGLLGCLAARYGWETWYLPIACHHFGGRTAVGDEGYQAWAKTQVEGGDHGFWERAHEIGFNSFRDVLPLRV